MAISRLNEKLSMVTVYTRISRCGQVDMVKFTRIK